MTSTVREPLQVYLTSEERSELDRIAREMGVSRSEALRRGIRAIWKMQGMQVTGPLRKLVEQGFVTPATAGPAEPPPRAPVAPLEELLRELSEDRSER